MPRRAQGLTAAKVAKAKKGRFADGDGLYLLARAPDAKFWILRFVRAGKMREMGLGPATGKRAVSLVQARKKARDLWDKHKEGRDPLAERTSGRSAAHGDAANTVTFEQAACDYIAAHRAGWRNPVHAKQWESTLATYAFPKIGKVLVADIKTTHVVEVLKPIWYSRPETASRLRGRIEKILGQEKVLEHRTGENPARWKENIDTLLPKKSMVQRVEHHPAMPYKDIGDFMAKLRGDAGTTARALEFCILTATRTNEVVGARWDEIDLDEKLWTIPAKRMKGGREHKVPLSSRVLEILHEMKKHAGDYVFPGRYKDEPLSNMALLMLLRRMHDGVTTHGFRSTFRDWCAESTNFPNHVAEMALAHKVSNDVEAAYRRGDLLAKRFDLAEKWSEFCAQPSITGGKVLPIRGSAS